MNRRIWSWVAVAVAAALVVLWLLVRTPDLPAAALRAKYGAPPSQFVEVAPGLTVHLRDEGPRGAPVLLLLHGSNSFLQTWDGWVQRLGGRYRIVRFDFPGHGLTGADPGRAYSKAAFVKVVEEVVAARHLGRFVIAGNSMGGQIAWHYAARHPDRVRGLILVDSSGAPVSGDTRLPLGFKLALLPGIRSLVEKVLPRSLIETSLHQTVSNQAVVTPAAVDRYWELLRYPGNRTATLDRFAIPYEQPDPADLKRLTMPVLILWGREDRLIPVETLKWYTDALPQTKTVIYDHIGHLPMEETPDASAADVGRFMAALDDRPLPAQ